MSGAALEPTSFEARVVASLGAGAAADGGRGAAAAPAHSPGLVFVSGALVALALVVALQPPRRGPRAPQESPDPAATEGR